MMDLLFPGIKEIAAANDCSVDHDFIMNEYIFKSGNKVHKKRLSEKHFYCLASENRYAELSNEVREICRQLNKSSLTTE